MQLSLNTNRSKQILNTLTTTSYTTSTTKCGFCLNSLL